MNETFILAPVCVPIVAGIILEILKKTEKMRMNLFVAAVLAIESVLVFINTGKIGSEVTLFSITDNLPVYFKIDKLGIIFAILMVIIWLLAGIFSFEYMKHEDNEKRYQGFYLIVIGVLIGLDFAGNLVTFYMFYEMMTLTAFPLVIHTGKKEATMAGLKYLYYSLGGAYFALFGFYFVFKYADSITFKLGGTLTNTAGHDSLLLLCALFMIIGFGVKAGMFPMHAWLTSAHPVAPAPASAVLSGIIVKTGILGIIRVIFYIFGTEFIRGTYVQTTWMILSLVTVFLGSTMAYKEKVLKKRLAYSTVSQISYIMFGLSLLNETAFEGSMLHVLMHAFTKCGLFLTAGAIIYKTGKTKVDELRGIGKEMPVLIWCYTLLSITLIGIPPTGGLASKWYICEGAIKSELPVFYWLGPVILLISALLTAGYLLPITIKGFFPGEDFNYDALEKKEPDLTMLIPVIILTAGAVGVGLFSSPLAEMIKQAVSGF
ncbi:MAG: proton-conducting membrane transporter [Lachnospiraceae bacterium]|nr:proton-conducting membrane transporter [Lachnospiraceae bacterium]